VQIAIQHEHSISGEYTIPLQFARVTLILDRHVDLRKAYTVLLGNFYKTLYNISVRRRAEEEDPGVKAVLEKQQRTDVSQDENLLTKMERELLKEWECKRERLTILEMRVEEVVFILRDLAPLDTYDD
jgi:DNA-directed RNA polymerase III subunit RPC3